MTDIDRRDFLVTSGTAALGTAAGLWTLGSRALGAQRKGHIKKAVKYHMIREDLSPLDKLKLLADLGYDGVEPRSWEDVDRKALRRASEATGVRIHGVVNSSRPDIKSAVDLSKYYGGTSVLIVAGRVNKETPYDVNYRETQKWLRENLPYAEKQGIKLLIENVWNNFLLSPLEMARYIDELDSPAAGVYFDVGNVVRMGWPQHWIRVLGERIVKLDVKEYSRRKQRDEGLWKGFQVELGEGDCQWPEVRKALAEIGYTEGWATAEVRGGDRKRLADLADRMDQVLALAD